jgi:hypothetical protein
MHEKCRSRTKNPAISDGAESWDFMQAHYRGISDLPKYIARYIHATVTIDNDGYDGNPSVHERLNTSRLRAPLPAAQATDGDYHRRRNISTASR